jgi:flagellar protein FlgJ
LPISAPNHVALDVMRPPALPDIAAARTELARRSDAAANATFSVEGATEAAAPAEAGKTTTPETFRRFEAMVLQTFIQNMLPKDGAAVYGKGMAGEMWKSMLAEKVAAVVAERGGIGIADRMLGGRYAAEAKPVAETTEASRPAEVGGATEGESRFRVAPVVIDGMQRSLSELLTEASALPAREEIQSTNG